MSVLPVKSQGTKELPELSSRLQWYCAGSTNSAARVGWGHQAWGEEAWWLRSSYVRTLWTGIHRQTQTRRDLGKQCGGESEPAVEHSEEHGLLELEKEEGDGTAEAKSKKTGQEFTVHGSANRQAGNAIHWTNIGTGTQAVDHSMRS